MSLELLSIKQVLEMTGLDRRTLFRYRENGTFPGEVRVGPHNVCFQSDVVAQWLRQHPKI